MTYVGRNSCGCIGLLVVDSADHARDTARELARAVRQGMTIERVETEWVRTPACSLQPCPEGQPCVREKQRAQRRKKSASNAQTGMLL